MSKCTNCGCNLIGTADNPPKSQLCSYCKVSKLKVALMKMADCASIAEVKGMLRVIKELPHTPEGDASILVLETLLEVEGETLSDD